jgi:hypothetical protein
MSDQPVVSRPGSMPAGLEEPPRIFPPNPQHPEIPQTYDPRVSVQLERAARDRASGKPGSAARDDAEGATIDPKGGAGPQPRRLSAAQRNTAVAVEGIPPRETAVTFTQQFASYFPGESAAFTEDEAARLADLGVTDSGDGGTTPPTEAPVNVDVPHATQDGDTLNCTMGNWEGVPTAYAYQWQIDSADVGTDSATHTVTADDAGKTATCTVTATNAIGSTAAPPSNALVVTDPGGATTRSARAKR